MGGGDVIKKSQFGPTGRTSHPYSQHGSSRTTDEVSSRQAIEVVSAILESVQESVQGEGAKIALRVCVGG